MKKIISTIIVLCMSFIMVFTLASCNSAELHDKEYNNKVNAYKMWKNDITEAIPQINISKRVRNFLNAKSPDGKVRKVLFLGYDGCRADRMKDIFDVKTGQPKAGRDSAILETIDSQDGGIYLAYCGGNRHTSTEQATATGPGWASLLTGVWRNHHGIIDNMYVKNSPYRSFVLEAALGKFGGRKMNSTFVASSTMHFATQYIDEINYLRAHPKDGATMPKHRTHESFIKEKGKWSESYHVEQVMEYVNAIMPNTSISANYIFTDETGKPEDFKDVYYCDVNAQKAMINAINEGDDVVFGILEATDHAGHNVGFSKGPKEVPEYIAAFEYVERLGAEIVRTVEERMKNYNEDWLIIVTTDHGGYNDGHGRHSFEERTTWVASNKKIPSQYYSRDYDGFNGKLRMA